LAPIESGSNLEGGEKIMKTWKMRESTESSPRPSLPWGRLLMTFGLLLLALTLTAEGCPNDEAENSGDAQTVKKTVPLRPKWKIIVKPVTVKRHGDLVHVKMTVTCKSPGPPYPDEAVLMWETPRQGRPGELDWPGEFVRYLKVNQDTGVSESLTVEYWERIPPDWTTIGDTFTAISPWDVDGPDESSTSVTHQIGGTGGAAAWVPPAPPELDLRTPSGNTDAPQADYYLWQTRLWFFQPETTMTTELCQDWVDFLQADTTFAALRFPVQPPTLTYTEPYTLPVSFAREHSPTLALKDSRIFPFTDLFTVSLEYKPRHFTFLENELPAAPGEHWLALGVVPSPTLTCPAGLNLGPDDWLSIAEIWLDLGGGKDAYADSLLPLYYCYEGEESPFATTLASWLLDGDLSVTSYQGWGITCLGPHPFRLLDWALPDPSPPFELHGSNFARIQPSQAVSLSHRLRNLGVDPVTVNLEYASEAGLTWEIYSGTEDGPDMPLTGPLMLPDPERYIWLVTTVPGGAASGPETVVVTATDTTAPAQSSWTSNLLWIGDWVAPPPQPWTPRYEIYLPVIIR
jgi:hypothetical protein